MSPQGPFDKLPPLWQHLVVAVVPILLGWAGTDLVPALKGWNPLVGAAAGVVVAALVGILTPVTTQFGVTRWRRR